MIRIISMSMLMLTAFSIQAQGQICPGADIVVSAEGMSYSPAALIVDVGTTIGWVNYEGYHDVNGQISSISQMSFNNPEDFYLPHMYSTPEGVCLGTHTFTIPGVYFYDCSSYGHAEGGMVANITVMAVVPGCTDYLACNYDIVATEDDNSCEYTEWGYDCDGNCVIDLDEDGICDTCLEYDMIVEDCECDFFDPATYTVFFINIDEENCVYIEDCYCECYNDEDGDGICDENEEGTIVDEVEDLSALIYPNPVSNNLTIDLGDLTGINTSIKLYDSSSKLVFEKLSSATLLIDVSVFAKGLYTLELSTSDKVLRSRVVLE